MLSCTYCTVSVSDVINALNSNCKKPADKSTEKLEYFEAFRKGDLVDLIGGKQENR